jgi:hypothetical protein
MDKLERATSTARRALALAHGILGAAEDVRMDLERALEDTLRAGDASLSPLALSLRQMIDRLKHEPIAPASWPAALQAVR